MPCGKGTLTREHPLKAGIHQYLRAKCKKLACLECGPVKTKHYQAAVHKAAAAHKLHRHIILTLDPGLIPADVDSVTYIQQVWTRFRSWMQDKRGLSLTYIRVIQLQENGTAHFHLVVSETITQETIIEGWTACGGGHQCRIRFRDPHRGAEYITRYITRELMLVLPKGRRILSCSRGILLFEKLLPSGWAYSRLSFLEHIMLSFSWSFTESWLSGISDYFESESPPDDLTEAHIYGFKTKHVA